MFKVSDHTFAVCAYKQSPFLGECIDSLLKQTVLSRVIVCTSTPNDYIKGLCDEYSLPLYVSHGCSGIARDWNFALKAADCPLVTIAHQDDVYKPEYFESALSYLNRAKRPLLFFSGYSELRGQDECDNNTLLNIKRLMLRPLERQKNSSSVFVRRRILSLGDPIDCPSITYVLPNLPSPLFKEDYYGSLDWQMLEEVSRLSGDFTYNPAVLMSHRIHAGSETSSLIESHQRSDEDLDMFCKFWPRPIALLISKAYSLSQKSNG